MQNVYALREDDKRRLKFLYHQGGIDTRYSVVPDYCLPAAQWQFYPASENLEPFPKLEKRMEWYQREAAPYHYRPLINVLKIFPGKKLLISSP